MGKAQSLAVIGLALLAASPVWAGSHGNGADQRRAAAGLPPLPAKTYFAFCYGGSHKVVYFSPVLVQTAGITGIAFGQYLSKTYGPTSNDGGQCRRGEVKADVVTEKKKAEDQFATMPKPRKIIETKWGLPASPATPVSPPALAPTHH